MKLNTEFACNTLFITTEETMTETPLNTDPVLLLIPTDDRLIIEKIEEDDVTKGGLYLPPSAKEKPMRGKVLFKGPGRLLSSGERVPIGIEVGDTVLFGKHAGTTVQLYGNDLLILKEIDIFAKIVERAPEEVKKAA